MAFAEWLGVYDLGPQPVGAAVGLWTPREVALAGLRETRGLATARPFATGLKWLMSRQFFRPHVPPVFEADPLAILAVAIGARHRSDDAAGKWIADIAKKSAEGETDDWRLGLLAAVTATGTHQQPEVVAALATCGIGAADVSTVSAARDAALAADETSAERAAFRLAVLVKRHAVVGLRIPSEGSVQESQKTTTEIKMKVLFLAANPTTTNQLQLDEEMRAIEEKVRFSQHRDAVEVISKWAVRPDDLQLALLQVKPMVVHFSGHGAGSPGIVLHGEVRGTEYLVPADALKHLFSTLKKNIRVVVLNACETEEQASAVAEVIDFVIGMDASIHDETARRFSAAFYLGLASGESVATSFEMGISAVKLHGLPDADVPSLHVRPGASADDVLV